MKRNLFITLLLTSILLTACGNETTTPTKDTGSPANITATSPECTNTATDTETHPRTQGNVVFG